MKHKDNANEVFLCLLAMSGFMTFAMSGFITWLSYSLGIMFLGFAIAYTIEEVRGDNA